MFDRRRPDVRNDRTKSTAGEKMRDESCWVLAADNGDNGLGGAAAAAAS